MDVHAPWPHLQLLHVLATTAKPRIRSASSKGARHKVPVYLLAIQGRSALKFCAVEIESEPTQASVFL